MKRWWRVWFWRARAARIERVVVGAVNREEAEAFVRTDTKVLAIDVEEIKRPAWAEPVLMVA